MLTPQSRRKAEIKEVRTRWVPLGMRNEELADAKAQRHKGAFGAN